MDPRSHRLANALVGNGPETAALEITLTGPELELDEERVVAVAGAELAIEVDGRRQATHSPFTVPAAARVRVGERTAGARAYLAIAGGFDVPPVLGSRATHVVSRMGGLDGRALLAGDRIPLGAPPTRPPVAAAARMPLPVAGEATRLRVLPGPHDDRFAAGVLDVLESAPYTVGAQSDRMGFRLEGPHLAHAGPADIVSDVTPLGVLQVPASGQPVILMADRQTTGGYTNLATIISADIGLAGQLVPGDQIRFEVCTRSTALAALIRQEQILMAVERGVS
jgi:antagonist of KipI